MRIRLLSDLHMEGYKHYYEYAGEDLVVLAGDIHTQNRHRFLLDQIPPNIKVLFVCGNHEYYGATFEYVNEFFYNLQAEYSNFIFLENENIIINGVDFYGGTMFSNWELYNDSVIAKQRAKQGIADFSWIDKLDKDGQKRRWNVEDHYQEHLKFKEGLKTWLEKSTAQKKVVISHFVPSPKCIHPMWEGSSLNPYFTSNMEEFMGWDGLWLFGHTHNDHDIMIGNTRLVCNPKGYGQENETFSKKLILEI